MNTTAYHLPYIRFHLTLAVELPRLYGHKVFLIDLSGVQIIKNKVTNCIPMVYVCPLKDISQS